MKPIIKVERPKFQKGTLQAREDWAKVLKASFVLKPPLFFDTTTGERFCHIVGGIAYPTAEYPGCVIVIGIQADPKVRFLVLEFLEDRNVFTLIKKTIDYREKYGFGLDSRILPWWYGDQLKFQTLIVKASIALEKKLGTGRGLYIKDMVDLREKHSFPLYIRQLYNTLETRRLDYVSHNTLVSRLESFQPEDAEKHAAEIFPTVGLLGGIAHSLQIEQPWRQDTDQGQAFNVPD